VKIVFENAKSIAIEALNSSVYKVGVPIELIEADTIEIDGGWIFFWNSSEYLQTGNFSSALVGNGPIFVGTDKTVYFLPSHQSWHKTLSEMGLL
jgi:Immunity protein 35